MEILLNDLDIETYLNEKYEKFNKKWFIETDPIQIPHQYKTKEDIEIAAFLTATIAWGKRSLIIDKAQQMQQIMQLEPYYFLMRHDFNDEINFQYRTFMPADFTFFLRSLQNIYKKHGGLEQVFSAGYLPNHSVYEALIHFRKVFFEVEFLDRSQKHVANVLKNSTAKRLNMFLMWLVRNDGRGVHFGLWDSIKASHLMLPLDVHTGRISRQLGLLQRKQNDWKSVVEITEKLKAFDPTDPVKYDFSLFGLGIFEQIHHAK